MTEKRKRTTEADRKLRRHYSRRSSLTSKRAPRRVEASFPRPRRLVALRIEEGTLERVRRLATERGLNFSTLMRMWITERLRQETR